MKLLNNQKFTDYELKKVGTSGAYLNQREVTKRVELTPGTYVIIPSLYKKNKRMKFILRVYVEGSAVNKKEINDSQDVVNIEKRNIGTSKDLMKNKSVVKKPIVLIENGEEPVKTGVCTML